MGRASYKRQSSPYFLDESATFIYCLKEPDCGTVRYVGKANIPTMRYGQHLCNPYPKAPVDAWIEELRQLNKMPVLEILEKVSSVEWGLREQAWIKMFEDGGELLLNVKAPHRNPTGKRIRRMLSSIKCRARNRAIRDSFAQAAGH